MTCTLKLDVFIFFPFYNHLVFAYFDLDFTICFVSSRLISCVFIFVSLFTYLSENIKQGFNNFLHSLNKHFTVYHLRFRSLTWFSLPQI